MNHAIYCKHCGKEVDPKIIDDVHLTGIKDNDIVCPTCTKKVIRNILDRLDKMEKAARAVLGK